MIFSKLHSFGNDFIVIRLATLPSYPQLSELAIQLCDRHAGVGADGLLIITPSSVATVKATILNADGSLAQMCGNGMRCLAQLLYDHHGITTPRLTIETDARLIEVALTIADQRLAAITLKMGQPEMVNPTTPLQLSFGDCNYAIQLVQVGVPHAIVFTPKLDPAEVVQFGPLIERHPQFAQGVNVNWVEIVSPQHLKILTWERGVGLSLACGTGAAAAVVAAQQQQLVHGKTVVQFKLGSVTVEWPTAEALYLTGPSATLICTGTILLESLAEETIGLCDNH